MLRRNSLWTGCDSSDPLRHAIQSELVAAVSNVVGQVCGLRRENPNEAGSFVVYLLASAFDLHPLPF